MNIIVNDEINYKANPLHGVGLKRILVELVDHYGFDILFAYLNINCFKNNPSVDSSVIFLKKTEWAREKVEAFYLYKYINLPPASDEQAQLAPRDRVVSEDQKPGQPAVLSLEEAEQLQARRASKSAAYNANSGKDYDAKQSSEYSKNRDDDFSKDKRKSSSSAIDTRPDPWAKWRK